MNAAIHIALTPGPALEIASHHAKWRFMHALVSTNPWEPDFKSQIWQGMHEAVQPLMPEVFEIFKGWHAVSALQQSWSELIRKSLLVGLLYRTSVSHPATRDEAQRLRSITLARWQARKTYIGNHHQNGLVDMLFSDAATDIRVPDLGNLTQISGRVRLRYLLAYRVQAGDTLKEFLRAAANQRAVTVSQRIAEVDQAVRATTAAGRGWRRLTELDFALLSDLEQSLVMSARKIWPLVFTKDFLAKSDFEAHAKQLIKRKKEVFGLITQLLTAIRLRKFDQVNQIVPQIDNSPLSRGLCAMLRTGDWAIETVSYRDGYKSSLKRWIALEPEVARWLKTWAPAPLPACWTLPMEEMVPAILSGRLAVSHTGANLAKQDLELIQQSLSEPEKFLLVRSGRSDLISIHDKFWKSLPVKDLPKAVENLSVHGRKIFADRLLSMPDPRPWLELMAMQTTDIAKRWIELAHKALQERNEHYPYPSVPSSLERWIAPSVGRACWQALEPLFIERVNFLDLAIDIATRRWPQQASSPQITIKYDKDFAKAVAMSIKLSAQHPKTVLNKLLDWINSDRAGVNIHALAKFAPDDVICLLVRSKKTPLAYLDAVLKVGPSSVYGLTWEQRLSRATDATDLGKIALFKPCNQKNIPWRSAWLSWPHAHRNGSLVLIALSHPHRMKAVHKAIGSDAFKHAVQIAARRLDTSRLTRGVRGRDVAFLDLLGRLGITHLNALVTTSWLMDHKASTGYKLDTAYQTKTIPKKNGGERLISSPHPALKQIQRAVLEKILEPLGHHPCAYGFVAGRSIVDNAKVHVGQPIVVNADIKNCFGNVGWPLIRAALIDKLQGQISRPMLALLIDLCTANGVLPTGAPTSPALLNLVLWKTDEILNQQCLAQGVRYTRYADDLTFSGDRGAVAMLGIARYTLSRIHLQIDPAKTNIFRRGRRQMVTGLSVNDKTSVPRHTRKLLRAAIHQLELWGTSHWQGQPQTEAALRGRIAFVEMADASQGQKLVSQLLIAQHISQTNRASLTNDTDDDE